VHPLTESDIPVQSKAMSALVEFSELVPVYDVYATGSGTGKEPRGSATCDRSPPIQHLLSTMNAGQLSGSVSPDVNLVWARNQPEPLSRIDPIRVVDCVVEI